MCGAGCGCGPCQDGAIERYTAGAYGNYEIPPQAAHLPFGALIPPWDNEEAHRRAHGTWTGAQSSSWLPNFTTSASVRAYKEHLNPIVQATDQAFYQCEAKNKLPPADIAAWIAWKGGWDTFYAADDSWLLGFGTAPLFTQAQAYDDELTAWRAKFTAAGCAPGGVDPASPAPPPIGIAAPLGAGALLGAGAVVLALLLLKR